MAGWAHGWTGARAACTSSLTRFDLDTLAMTSPRGNTASVAALHGLAGMRQTSDGYDVRWAGDDRSALALSLHQPGTAQASVGVAARDCSWRRCCPGWH